MISGLVGVDGLVTFTVVIPELLNVELPESCITGLHVNDALTWEEKFFQVNNPVAVCPCPLIVTNAKPMFVLCTCEQPLN